jgi:hypothetical protein
VTVTGSFPLEDIWTVNFREAGPLTASSPREDFICMTIVFRRLKAIFLAFTARFTSVDPRMSNQDRLFLSGHGLDTIREIAQQFPRDGQLGVRLADLQRSREFARDLMDFVDPEMSFGDFIHGANQAFASWRSELDRRSHAALSLLLRCAGSFLRATIRDGGRTRHTCARIYRGSPMTWRHAFRIKHVRRAGKLSAMLLPGANTDDQSRRARAKIRKIDVVCRRQLKRFQVLIARGEPASIPRPKHDISIKLLHQKC